MTDTTEVADLYTAARKAARELVDTHSLPGHTVEDLTQAGVLWCLEHSGRVERCRSEAGYNLTQLVAEIQRGTYADVLAEQREVRRGTSEVHGRYTKETLGLILPGVWDDEYMPPRPESSGSSRPEVDPARYGTWAAMRADATQAVAQLGRYEVGLLMAHYLVGFTWEEIGVQFEVPKSTVYRQAMAAMDVMLEFLNGEPTAPVPFRHSVSNAAAQAQLAHAYGG